MRVGGVENVVGEAVETAKMAKSRAGNAKTSLVTVRHSVFFWSSRIYGKVADEGP